jgi:hypothetical protein
LVLGPSLVLGGSSTARFTSDVQSSSIRLCGLKAIACPHAQSVEQAEHIVAAPDARIAQDFGGVVELVRDDADKRTSVSLAQVDPNTQHAMRTGLRDVEEQAGPNAMAAPALVNIDNAIGRIDRVDEFAKYS